MTSSLNENPNNFIPESYIFPEDNFPEYDLMLRRYLSNISAAVNTKDSGLYADEEVVTGQQFFPLYSTDTAGNLNYRNVFRKVIDFGALPDNTTKAVPHGISTTEDFSIVKLYGTATDPGVSTLNLAVPIPSPSNSASRDHITLEMDATDILIMTNSNTYIDFTRTFVVVEYIKIV